MGANKSNLVTKTSSLGKWVPVHDDEWDGDIPLKQKSPGQPDSKPEDGEVAFGGEYLPWQTGRYEVRCVTNR